MSYKKILLPVSATRGLERSSKELAHALNFHPEELVLINAIDPLSQVVGGEAHAELLRSATARALAKIGPLLNKIEATGIPYSAHVMEGTPADTIIKAAHMYNCDMIIMYTDGRDGLEDLLIGSTTERVLRDTDLPLLAIRK